MVEVVQGTMAADPPTVRNPPSIKQVVAVMSGNALEFYDFLTFSFFAVQIGQVFFPSDKPINSLLATLATFGAGFLTRPVGAFFIGRYADRIGRKPALMFSFMLMGLAIVGMALTPGFKTIGVAAPILVIVFRLLQGFALGGELGSSTAFMIEAAPKAQRGAFVSLQYLGQGLAVMVAGLVGVALSGVFDADGLRDYGWRIALLFGAVIIPFGLILRRGLEETLHMEEAAPHAAAEGGSLMSPARIAIVALIILAGGTIANYVLNYMTTYATTILKLPSQAAFGATVVNGFVGVIFALLGGWMSDRVGRKAVMLWPWLALLILTLPSFYLLSQIRTPMSLWVATGVLGAIMSFSSGGSLVAITESLPKHSRAGILSLVYALSIATFGGSAQFVVAWLTDITKNDLAPAWYMSAAVAIALGAMLFVKETAPVKTERG